MADNYKTFKKRYQEGKIPEMAMPPIVPGPGGAARSVAAAVARPLVRYLAEGVKSAAKNARVAGRAKSLEKAGKAASKQKNPLRRGDTGTLTDKLAKTRTRPRTEKESEKFGPLAKRQENLPATQSRAIVKREDKLPATRGSDSRALTVAREGKGDLVRTGGGRSLATHGTRTFGDKGQGGRIVGLSTKGKLAAGAVGAGAAGIAYAGYKQADKAKSEPRREKLTSGPRDDRAPPTRQGTSPENKAKTPTSSSVGGTKNGPFKSEFAQRSLQGRNPNKDYKPSKSSPVIGKAGRAAPKAMSPFERQKAKQYEEQGYGGRSMTREGAKKQAVKERGYKFKDLFK